MKIEAGKPFVALVCGRIEGGIWARKKKMAVC